MHSINEYNERRKSMRMTYKELSLLSGVPARTVQDILSGRTKSPRLDTVEALERILYPLQDNVLTDEECALVGLWREMDGTQRDLAMRIIKDIMA